MPGIVGIISSASADQLRRDLEEMVAAMRHTPDMPAAAYQDPEIGLAVARIGHSPPLAHLGPRIVRSENATLLLNGECFGQDGELSASVTDPCGEGKKLLAAIESSGPIRFISSLNGWFNGVLVNRRTREITLFNDRYGMERLYICEGPEEFLFASEAKALLAVRPHLRSLAPSALAELLRYNCVIGDKALFSGVGLLPRASAWTFSNSHVPHRRQYFDFADWEKQDQLSPEEFEEAYSETVTRTVPAYARGPERVAISLTAGLDTRQIMAALGASCAQHPCYTFDGTFGELFDTRVARKLASVYGSPFDVIRVGDSFIDEFPRYAVRTVHISDGTHEPLGAHDVYLNEIARTIAPIRLTGKFGSEVVRIRNIVPSLDYPQGLLSRDLAALVAELPHHSRIRQSIHPLTSVVTHEIPYHEHGRLAVEKSQLIMRSPYMDNDLVQLMYRAPDGTRAEARMQERYVLRRSPEFASPMTNLGRFASLGGHFRNNPLLVRSASLALHVLFKAEYIYLYGTPHWLTALDSKLPMLRLNQFLAGRQKWEGYRLWMRQRFSSFLQDTLLSPSIAYGDYFDRRAVGTLLERHLAGTHNYMSEINRVLMVELIATSLLQPARSHHEQSSLPLDELWVDDTGTIDGAAHRA